jgi:hypothetical protein
MTLYDELGVPPSASKAEIKRAAKAKMQSCHPDREGGSEAEFKRINAAKRLLMDDRARARYDETGSTGKEEPEPITDEQHAVIILGKIFIAILEKDIHNGDLIYAMRVEIAKGMREGPQVTANHKRKIAKVERTLAKNLKQAAGKPSYLQNALAGHLQLLKTQLAQMELAERIGPLMLEILKDYRWEADAPASTYGMFQSLYSDPMIKSIFDSKGF